MCKTSYNVLSHGGWVSLWAGGMGDRVGLLSLGGGGGGVGLSAK